MAATSINERRQIAVIVDRLFRSPVSGRRYPSRTEVRGWRHGRRSWDGRVRSGGRSPWKGRGGEVDDASVA